MFGKNTTVYKNLMITAEYFRDLPYDLEMINLGSTVAFNDFDYELIGKKGANLAQAPQTLYYDYQILKKYMDHLADNAVVCVGVCHFTFLVFTYKRISANLKYYKILDAHNIFDYHPAVNFLWKNAPCFVMPSIIKEILKRKQKIKPTHKTYSEAEDVSCALKWLEGWKIEFGWKQKIELNEVQIRTIKQVYGILQEIFEYCKIKGKKPILVIPPVSENLIKIIPEEFFNQCFLKYIKEFEEAGNQVVNFWGDKELSSYKNFCDALNLNEKGKRQFCDRLNKAIYIK